MKGRTARNYKNRNQLDPAIFRALVQSHNYRDGDKIKVAGEDYYIASLKGGGFTLVSTKGFVPADSAE
jgi:hypothetical protein